GGAPPHSSTARLFSFSGVRSFSFFKFSGWFTAIALSPLSWSCARTDGKCASRYNRLDDLILVIFVATGGRQANYSAGNTTSTPFFFRRITMNFAGSVVLALRPTVCTSLGPS